MDLLYARSGQAAGVMSNAAVFLLLVSAFVILFAIVAIGFSWNAAAARNLMVASLMVFVLEFLIPVL